MIEESVWHTYKNKVIAPNYLWKKIALSKSSRRGNKKAQIAGSRGQGKGS